jgi:hypothetical protein
MSPVKSADAATATSILSGIASFLAPVTSILQFLLVVVGLIAGYYAIRVHRRNLRK